MSKTYRRKSAGRTQKQVATTYIPWRRASDDSEGILPGSRVPIPGLAERFHRDSYRVYKCYFKEEYNYIVTRRHRRLMAEELRRYQMDPTFEVQSHRATTRRHNRISLTRFQPGDDLQ